MPTLLMLIVQELMFTILSSSERDAYRSTAISVLTFCLYMSLIRVLLKIGAIASICFA